MAEVGYRIPVKHDKRFEDVRRHIFPACLESFAARETTDSDREIDSEHLVIFRVFDRHEDVISFLKKIRELYLFVS